MEVYNISKNKKNVKSIIINVLSKQFPLNTKKIHNYVKSQHNLPITYQAVHKALGEFLEEGLVMRQGKEYLLNPQWIQSVSNFSDELINTYEKKKLIKSDKKIQQFTFNSIGETIDFTFSGINSGFFGESDEFYAQMNRFFLIPLSKKELVLLRDFIKKKKVYIFCRNKKFVDCFAARFLRSLGAKVKLGVDCARPSNALVYGNSFIQVHGIKPSQEYDKLEEEYENAKGFDRNVFSMLSLVLQRKIKIKLTVNRDPEIVQDVISETKKLL